MRVSPGGGPCSLPKFDFHDVTIIFNFKWNHCKIQNIDLYFQYNLHMLWYHFRRSVEANWDWIHLNSNSFPISSPICTGILGYISGQFLSSYLLIDYIFMTKDFDDPDLFFFHELIAFTLMDTKLIFFISNKMVYCTFHIAQNYQHFLVIRSWGRPNHVSSLI